MQRRHARWIGTVLSAGMIGSIIVLPIRHTWQQEQKRQQLFHAIQIDDTNTVRTLLASGLDANVRAHEGTAFGLADILKSTLHLPPRSDNSLSALMWAVLKNGDPEIARLLVTHGARVNVQEGGWTPLSAALATGSGHPNRDLIRFLLEHGADPNLRPPGDGPLFYALNADGPNVDLGPLTKMLLDHGADPLQLERDGRSYLTSEIWAKHPKTVTAMLAHGADINARDKDTMGIPGNPGTTPLGAAITSQQPDMMKLLLAHGERVEMTDRKGAIREAAYRRNESLLQTLLTGGVDIDSKDRSGFTPLMDAAYGGEPRQITGMETLLAHGASVRARNDADQTALIVACWYPQDLPKVKILLAHGADPNAADQHGFTALHYASGMAGGATVRYLLAHGANARLTAEGGQTTLMRAAEIDKGHPEAVAPLAAAGCDPNAQDKKGQTALMLARLKHHTAVVAALLKAGAKR